MKPLSLVAAALLAAVADASTIGADHKVSPLSNMKAVLPPLIRCASASERRLGNRNHKCGCTREGEKAIHTRRAACNCPSTLHQFLPSMRCATSSPFQGRHERCAATYSGLHCLAAVALWRHLGPRLCHWWRQSSTVPGRASLHASGVPGSSPRRSYSPAASRAP